MIRRPAERAIITLLLAFALISGMTSFGWNDVQADDQAAEGISFSDTQYRKIRSRKINGRDLCVNLRTLIGEKAGGGYSVVQGGCTDGKYVYYLMASSSTQRGRVLKLRLKDLSVVKRGPVVDTYHGNGMAYDSKRKRLVVVGCESRRCELVTIDAKTLRLTGKKKIGYGKAKNWGVRTGNFYYGLSAISYIPEYDCFTALQRYTRDILVLDSRFRVIGMARTDILEKYSGTYQAMDADERYVYLLLSEDQEDPERQPHNLILAIDWNSENLMPFVSGADPGFAKTWECSNKGNGREDAVIRINSRFEAENLFHVTDKSGRERFYMAEYCPFSTHKYVTEKVRQKVKWKKIIKDGKTTWKYRTKYVKKKVKVKINRAYRKDSYVYDLGII